MEVLQSDARQKYRASIKIYMQDADAIETQASGNDTAHLIKLERGTIQGELSFSMRNYTPEMLKIIALGLVIKISADGALTALGSAILPSIAFMIRYLLENWLRSTPNVLSD